MSFRTIAVVLTADSASLRSQLLLAARAIDDFDKGVSGAGRSVATSSEAMSAAAKGGALALAGGFAYAVRSAADFEAAMRNVNSISGLSEDAFRAQGQAVVDLSKQLPQSATTLAKGLYDIASSGFQGAAGLEVLKQSAIAASAGLTTTQNAAKSITAVLNAYGLSAADAGHVSDVLFQTVNLGVVNFEELTNVIGDTVGVAAAAGVSIDEVGAAVATMTLSGVSAAEAGTSLNRILTELLKPGDSLKAVLHSLGYESGQAALSALGLKGTMDLLRQATGGSAEAVISLFQEIRGARGAFALMADEGQKYAQVTDGLAHASDGAGASQKALNEQMKSLSAQWKIFVNDINAAAITGASTLLPFLGDVLRGSRELAADALPGLRSGLEALAPFFHNIAEAGGDVVDIARQLVQELSPLGQALLGLAAGGVIQSLNGLAAVLSGLTGFLADHEQVVTAVALAWAGFFLVAKGAAALAAVGGILEAVSVGLYDVAGGADTAAASLLTLKGAALGLGALAAILGLTAAVSGLQSAKKGADELYASVVKPFDLSSYQGLRDALDEIGQKQMDLEANTKTHGGLENAFRGALELLTPMKNSVQDARDALQKLNEEAERLAQVKVNVFSNEDQVARDTGRTREEVEKLANTLGVDLTRSFEESGPERQKLIDNLKGIEENAFGAGSGLAAMAGMSVEQIKADSDAVDELAKKTGDAFSKSFDLIDNFAKASEGHAKAVDDLASAQDKAASAADRVTQAQEQAAAAQQRIVDAQDKAVEASQRVTDAQEKVGEAEDRVAQMRQDFAEKSAEAQDAYAQKVQDSDDRILAAEQDLADKRISLAQSVADAQQRLEDDRQSGADRIATAEQRLRDVQAKNAQDARDAEQRAQDQRALNAAKDPEARKRVQDQIDARKAREDIQRQQQQAAKDVKAAQDDIAKARKDADDTEKKDREALAKAQLEQARGIQDAEEKVTAARKDGLEVQKEGQKLAKDQADQERQIADAVKDVESARRDVVKAQKDEQGSINDIAKAQSEAARAAGDVGKAQDAAARAYGDLADAQQKVADTSLEGFFSKTIADARRFADGITEAARQGLNPTLIAELLQEGPEKAAPLLQAIMSDNTGTLVGMLNGASGQLRAVQDQMVEAARVTQRAINATNTDTAAEFGTAMDILAAKAALGGQATADAIADKLGIGVDRVRQIASDYVIVLADGLNPVLKGVGAPEIVLGAVESTPGNPTGKFLMAGGGQVPGAGDTDSVPAMLMPGEFVARKTVVQTQGVAAFEDLNAGRADIVRRYAVGGFVTPDDVPKPPDFGPYGNMVGYSGQASTGYIYELAREFVRTHPPKQPGGGGGGGYGFQALIDYLNGKGIPNTVTSTTGGGHAEGSRHYMGLAADFVSDDMDQIGRAFMEIQASMYELIHNPGFSLKGGSPVDPSFWGSETWAEHRDHVHAATFKDSSEGPGIPGTGGGAGSESGGSAAGDDSRAIGRSMAADRGWTGSEWTALDKLWTQESSWDPNAVNSSSGAYGIPQSLGHGHPYDLGDTRSQVAWGLDYIADRYGDPEAAWQHEQDYGWYGKGGLVNATLRSYDQGGWLPPGLTVAYNGTGRAEAVGGGIDYDRLARAVAERMAAEFRKLPTPVLQVDKRQFGQLTAEALHSVRPR